METISGKQRKSLYPLDRSFQNLKIYLPCVPYQKKILKEVTHKTRQRNIQKKEYYKEMIATEQDLKKLKNAQNRNRKNINGF